MKTLLLLAALASVASAEDAAPAKTADAAAPAAAAAPSKTDESSAASAKTDDAAAAPAKADAGAMKEAVPASAGAPAKPAAPAKAIGPDDEWAFAKAAGEDQNAAVQKASIAELSLFARRRPDAAQAPDALLMVAALREKNGDWQRALADLLHLIAGYPESSAMLRAKSDYLALVDRRASRRNRPALSALLASIDAKDPADRLSQIWQALADRAPDAIYEPAVREIEDFVVRFPTHPDADKLLMSLARLHAANDEPAASLLAWRKLIALCPESALRARAQKSIGDLYADSLRDPSAAIAAYQELVAQYPQSLEVQEALEHSARLFEDKLRQYGLAVEQLERVVKMFPKTPASLRALKSIARLQRDRLDKSDDAIKTLQRLSAMHGGQDGIDALLLAANIAHRDLKDNGRQAALLHQVADDYAAAPEAPRALYDAAGVWEDAGNTVKAIEVYKEVATKYPSDRLAKKASDRVAKLAAK